MWAKKVQTFIYRVFRILLLRFLLSFGLSLCPVCLFVLLSPLRTSLSVALSSVDRVSSLELRLSSTTSSTALLNLSAIRASSISFLCSWSLLWTLSRWILLNWWRRHLGSLLGHRGLWNQLNVPEEMLVLRSRT